MPGGRPTLYNATLAAEICRRIASQSYGLRKICEADDMPSFDSVMTWLHKHPEFADQYAQARDKQAELLADECIEIADDDSQDILDVGVGGDMRSITNSAAVQRAKLRVDARKWKASQLAPKKWGQQQIKNEHTGAEGGPIKTETKRVDAPPQETREQWIARKEREAKGLNGVDH